MFFMEIIEQVMFPSNLKVSHRRKTNGSSVEKHGISVQKIVPNCDWKCGLEVDLNRLDR